MPITEQSEDRIVFTTGDSENAMSLAFVNDEDDNLNVTVANKDRAIVYVMSPKDANDLADWLMSDGA